MKRKTQSYKLIPLTAQLLSRASITMLAQILGGDEQARLTNLAVAPLAKEEVVLDHARYERLLLEWSGPKGEGQAALILKALPELTWSQAVNSDATIPAEVLLVEGDLSPAISQIIEDGFVASGRMREERPAWTLSHDLSHLDSLERQYDSETDLVVLQKTANFHALHWDARPILDDVYPWLPRFSDWIEAHCTLLRHILRSDSPPISPYYRWIKQQEADISEKIHRRWESLPLATLEPLQKIINNPTSMLKTIQQSPQSIIHGAWFAKNLCLQEGQLIASQWDYIQVGPAAWDLYCYLNSINRTAAETEAKIEQYFNHLRTIIPTLSKSECESFRQAFALCPLLYTLLQPFSKT